MTADTETVFESTAGLSETCQTALRHLLLACADTKLLLGYHYGEWTFGTPELEAAVASCSLSQTELGHVRLLHAILKKHYDDDPDHLVERRDASDFANIAFLDANIRNWPGFVAANYVVDLAVTSVLHAMQGSTFKPLRMSLEKMLDEERHHIHHGQGWFRALGRRDDATRDAVAGAVRDALTSVVEWFGPSDETEDLALVDAGIKTRTNHEILGDLLSDISRTANALGLSIEPDRPQSFDGWTTRTRRVRPGGPDEEILYHLRGSKNEIFKLT